MKKKYLKITAAAIAMVLVFTIVPMLALAAPAPRQSNVAAISLPFTGFATADEKAAPFYFRGEGEIPLISAHRAGGTLAPENTLSAFYNCVGNKKKGIVPDFKTDFLEFDVHLTAPTKDGAYSLILLHDATLDRTSNCVELFGETGVKPRSKTLAQLKELNMAENFKDPAGKYPYRGLRGSAVPDECRIVTLEEVLEYCEGERTDKTLHYTIEIKDSGEDGRRAADMLNDTLVKMDLTGRVLVGTFNGDITDYLDENYPGLTRAAGIIEVLQIFFSYLLNWVPRNVKYEVLVIPYIKLFPFLGSEKFISYAHKYKIACHFWTINTEADMNTLIANGADCIITDNPKLGCDVARKAA